MNIGFVGMGTMGRMLVTALAGSGTLQPEAIFVSNRSPEKLEQVARLFPGIHTAPSNADLARQCRTVFLCIKPGETRPVLQEMEPYITENHLLVAISNAIEIPALERVAPARVAKVIPSVVQAVGHGVSLLIFGDRCTRDDRALLQGLFSAISRPHVISECQARVASDLTSCGPAFVSYVLRALAQAARTYQPDLPADAVDAMIRDTVAGTIKFMDRTGCTFEEIIARVSTPGGITADGIKVLNEQMAGVWEKVIETTLVKEELKKAKADL